MDPPPPSVLSLLLQDHIVTFSKMVFGDVTPHPFPDIVRTSEHPECDGDASSLMKRLFLYLRGSLLCKVRVTTSLIDCPGKSGSGQTDVYGPTTSGEKTLIVLPGVSLRHTGRRLHRFSCSASPETLTSEGVLVR